MSNAVKLEDEDACFMGHVEGLYVGHFDTDEMDAFNDLCRRGLMRRCYSHPGGFFGLAKAEITATGHEMLDRYLAPASPLTPKNEG